MTARTSIARRAAVLVAAVAVLAALLVVYSEPDPPRVDLAGNPFAGVNVKLYCVEPALAARLDLLAVAVMSDDRAREERRREVKTRLAALLDQLDEQTQRLGEPPLRQAVAEQARERLRDLKERRNA